MTRKIVYVPIDEYDGKPDLRNIDCKRKWARECCPGSPIIKATLLIPTKELNEARKKIKARRP